MKSSFVICIDNKGYEVSLERWKVYQVMKNEEEAAPNHIRVVDESGEDYLYPSVYFMAIDVPKPLEEALTTAR